MPDEAPSPEQFPRRILLAVTGLSPQIVTETLYCLCLKRSPAFIPTEIHLITTAEGHQQASLTLLHPHQGKFRRLLEDFKLPAMQFDEDHIHILTGQDDQPLADIRNEQQNTAAANVITDLVRQLTADPESALHVSIAGGRKTMGFYLGYALTLFGRPQDRLSHVLVSPPFESNHQFYYPPPKPEVLFTRENQPINAADAEITLAEIPFVSLRHGMPKELLNGHSSYSGAVDAARLSFAPASLVINTEQRTVKCGNRTIQGTPQIFAFYSWLAQRRKHCTEHGGHIRYTDPDANSFLDVYKTIAGTISHDYETVEAMFSDGMPQEFFQEKKSRTNDWLRKELGIHADPYLIQTSGKRPRLRFGLNLPPEAISITSTTPAIEDKNVEGTHQ